MNTNTGPNILVIDPLTNCTVRTPEFNIILKIINDLAASGSLFLGTGYCVAMCDLLQPILLHYGIKSHIVEVTLTISYNQSQDNRKTLAIGFDNVAENTLNSIDTHVVLVTETSTPYIIDPSISNKLPHGRGVVIAQYNQNSIDKVLVDFISLETDIRLTYIQKILQRVPSAHQSSIINRINRDNAVDKKFKLLILLICTAMLISSLNFIRGAVDFYNVYYDTTNYWGPTHIKEIITRLDRLENKNKPVNNESK